MACHAQIIKRQSVPVGENSVILRCSAAEIGILGRRNIYLKNAIKHPSISGMLTQLTDNHECSGNVTEYRAAVIKGAVMPLCDAGKQKLEAIHPPQNLVRQ